MSDETTARGRGLVRLFWNLLALHPTALRGGIACFHLGAGIGSLVIDELYLPRVKDSFQFEVIVELFTCAILSIVSILLLGVEKQRSGPGLTSFGLFILAVSVFYDALGEVYVLPVALIAVAEELFMVAALIVLGTGLTLWYRSYQEAIRSLTRLSSLDPLTGAANRRAFAERLALEHARSRRNGKAYSIIALDLDHFKRVNDDFGHAQGDRVLQETARLMQGNLREVDLLARTGGEEFEILMSNAGGEEAAQLAERLRQCIRAHDFGAPGRISASFGVASSSPALTIEQLRKRADDALYSAKQAGRAPPRESAARRCSKLSNTFCA